MSDCCLRCSSSSSRHSSSGSSSGVFVCQLAAFYSDEMAEMWSWMNLHHYYRRMRQCIADQLEQHIRVSWSYAYQSSAGNDDQLIVGALNDGGSSVHKSAVGMLAGSGIFFYTVGASFDTNCVAIVLLIVLIGRIMGAGWLHLMLVV